MEVVRANASIKSPDAVIQCSVNDNIEPPQELGPNSGAAGREAAQPSDNCRQGWIRVRGQKYNIAVPWQILLQPLLTENNVSLMIIRSLCYRTNSSGRLIELSFVQS